MAVARTLLTRHLSGAQAAAQAGTLQRMHGEPHVWPRVWKIAGSGLEDEGNVRALKGWLASSPTPGTLRCGVAASSHPDELLVVATEALADLDPVPIRVQPGSAVDFRARLLVPAKDCALVVRAPSGAVGKSPMACERGVVNAQVPIGQPGEYMIQLVVNVEGGPRPALEASVFAGVEPRWEPAGGVWTNGQGVSGVLDRLNELRKNAGVGALVRSGALDRVAQAHAERALASHMVAHDAGDGPPEGRLARAGIDVVSGAENVAQASSLAGAQLALEKSPSHFSVMVKPAYDAVGFGTATDESGNVYLVELFAAMAR
ncbi:CAP domain-containing protein [Pendulispora albinea]|uniref:CAP domain-containing protein n=1 Tax=Pendulispora albinea TaxID=2741071 RepID=A0ABZ2LZC1_9BACT